MSTAPSAGAAERRQFLTFALGGEMFAIGILAIREIIEYHALTDVPMLPSCVRGVISLRGAAVPVVDLQARFGRAASAPTRKTCIVIVEVQAGDGRRVVGVVVDAVSEVLDIAAADIEPAPAFGAGVRSDFLHGLGKVRGRFVLLLDVDRVLAFDDLSDAVASASAAAPALSC